MRLRMLGWACWKIGPATGQWATHPPTSPSQGRPLSTTHPPLANLQKACERLATVAGLGSLARSQARDRAASPARISTLAPGRRLSGRRELTVGQQGRPTKWPRPCQNMLRPPPLHLAGQRAHGPICEPKLGDELVRGHRCEVQAEHEPPILLREVRRRLRDGPAGPLSSVSATAAASPRRPPLQRYRT